MVCLFVGLALPKEVRDRLAALQSGVPGARWTAPENFHLSLYFIGEVEKGQAEDIHHALSGICAPEFPLIISGVGTFGNAKKVRTLWAGVRHSQVLWRIQKKVKSSVARAGGASKGRKFSPHVTLAYLKEPHPYRLEDFLRNHEPFLAAPFPVRNFFLYRSHPGRSGAHYEALREYPLSEPQNPNRDNICSIDLT